MPPAPRGARISYGPRRVPAETGIGASILDPDRRTVRRVRPASAPDRELLVGDHRVALADRLEPLDLRPREAVDLVVEERENEGLPCDQLLRPPVDRLTI